MPRNTRNTRNSHRARHRLDPSTIEAVVFDIGGVFTIPHHEPIQAHLRSHGLAPSDDPAAYRRAHYRGVRVLTGFEPDTDYDPKVWRAYDLAYLAEIGITEEVYAAAGVASVPRAGFHLLIPHVWDMVLDDHVAAFRRIADGPRPLGVVSNNDGTAVEQLVRFGVAQVGDGPLPRVEVIIDSAIVGVAKPDPTIFTPALDALGIPAASVLYVGDTVHADVVGARRAGMQVVQIDTYGFHDDFDHDRIDDLDELADLLA